VGNPHRTTTQKHPSPETLPFDKIHYLDLAQKEICSKFLDWTSPTRVIHAAAIHTNSKEMKSFSARNRQSIFSVEVQMPSNIMEWQTRNPQCRYLILNSSQIFGSHSGEADSATSVSPSNTYSEAKLETFNNVRRWQNEGIDVRSAILFPHSSPYSRKTFLLQEIASQIVKVIDKKLSSIIVENATIELDISDARDTMLNVFSFLEKQSMVTNCVFGSGKLVKISQFIEDTLIRLNLKNTEIISKVPLQQMTSYASVKEMSDKIPHFTRTRDISLTLEEIVNNSLHIARGKD
jgi:GDP-D-mannose dehydratase